MEKDPEVVAKCLIGDFEGVEIEVNSMGSNGLKVFVTFNNGIPLEAEELIRGEGFLISEKTLSTDNLVLFKSK